MTETTVQDYLPARIWLMKTEPDTFSFNDLEKRPQQSELWDGVRNYQARNLMRDHMKVGDTVLFYHSNANPSGIIGEASIVKAAVPDLSALDKKSEYFDPKATPDNVRWVAVTVGKPVRYKNFIALDELRKNEKLAGMLVTRPGQRLSIMPVSENELKIIRKLSQ